MRFLPFLLLVLFVDLSFGQSAANDLNLQMRNSNNNGNRFIRVADPGDVAFLVYNDDDEVWESLLVEDAIQDTWIDWGLGAGQVSAADIPIVDAGGVFAGTNVEAALQEAGAGGAGGDSVTIDGAPVVNPDFDSGGDIDFVNTSNTITANINAGAVLLADLDAALQASLALADSAIQPGDIDTTTEINALTTDEDFLVDSDLIDDDTMATATATNVPSAESVKAYVDTEVAGASGTGDNVLVDGANTVDPDFVSTGDIDFTNTANTITADIKAGVVALADLQAAIQTSLGLADTSIQPGDIGVSVQAYDDDLADLADGTLGESKIDAAITRDAEWDTAAEINAATTDNDFLIDSADTVDAANINWTDVTLADLEGAQVAPAISFNFGSVASLTLPTEVSVNGLWSWTLPSDDGDAGDVLSTDGAGVTSWLTLGSAALSDDADFATAAQGALADSALQSADLDTFAEAQALVADDTLVAASNLETVLEAGGPYDLEIAGPFQLADTSADHNYIFGVSELAADRTMTLPILTGNDTFVFAAHADTLTNKTIDGDDNTLTDIGVASLKEGTDGELITWGADGEPTTVAAGTSGQVLTSNGAGAAPTFQDAAGGGGGGDSVWAEVALLEGNTAAQNTALVDAAIGNGDLRIQLPAGTFNVDPIDCVDNLHIRGQGIGATVLVLGARTITDDPAFGGAINVHGTSGDHITNVVLQDFTVDGNKANITIAGSTNGLNIECIDFNYADYCTTERVRCINSESEGLDYDNSTYCISRNCQFQDNDGYGVHMSTGSQYLRSENDTAIDCGIVHSRGGFDVHDNAGSNDCTYIGAYAKGCYRGFLVGGDRNSLIGCHVEGATNTGIRIDPGEQNLISGCRVIGTINGGNGITLASGAIRNSIVNTLSRGNGGSGIRSLAGATHNSFTSCQAHNNTANGIRVDGNSNIVIGCSMNSNTAGNFENNGTSNEVANNITS